MCTATTTVVVTLLCLTASVTCMDGNLNLTLSLIYPEMMLVDSGGKSNRVMSPFPFDQRPPSQLIIEGTEARSGEFPYMISIQVIYRGVKRYHLCGAVLVETNKALTAAHCCPHWRHHNYEHFVAVGYQRLTQQGQALIKVKDIVIHPYYFKDRLGFPNDIAVITFERHVELTDMVQLANMNIPNGPPIHGKSCQTVGWGKTEDSIYPDDLRHAPLNALTNYQCKLFFRIFGQTGLRYSHLCAWKYPHSACYADSGGPLVCDEVLVGITSWGADCTACYPIVYTRVSSHYTWIVGQLLL